MIQDCSDQYSVIENRFIELKDGRRLAARIWLPATADTKPVPAILEYLPYRKRDGTAPRDESTYPVFARAGYAGVRVDISGNGESDGDFDDEYSPRELSDGIEVIEWIASRDWCDGNVGMMGISWGGFNSLQIAALNPPPLKAVIAIGTTVDRYNDDIHYKNGCLLYSNFSWSSVMLCFSSRPPDPALVGERWREMWSHRLKTQPFLLECWLEHQRRDEYWQHGSVCEDYRAMQIPALVISGWADGYINAPPTALKHFPGITKAINGPWIHKYPHFAYPHPRIDFHQEALQWWDRWLKGRDNGAESLPAYRAYLSENVRPGKRRDQEEGRWVVEAEWPSAAVKPWVLYPNATGCLNESVPRSKEISVCSPLDCGTASGEFFPLKPDSELTGDQRVDDAGSQLFDTGLLEEAVEILGRPVMRLRVDLDRPVGNLAVRLVDLHPDGTGHRVSWGVLNLTHRDGNANPEPVAPGKAVDITVRLDECGYRFLPGHRIRVAISTNYWPMIMPPPEIVTATIGLGDHTSLHLPVRAGEDSYDMPEPVDTNSLPEYKMHRAAKYERRVDRDLQNGITTLSVVADEGESEIPGHGLRIRHRHEETWRITADDPLSANSRSLYICWMSRGDWSIRTESESILRCDAGLFHLEAKVTAYEGEEIINVRNWKKSIPRDCM